MSEKAELVDLLQEREHLIVQLAGETETIGGWRGVSGREWGRPQRVVYHLFSVVHAGEYIALYQKQRDALRAKFQEKDTFIQHLVVDRTAMQVV